MSALQKSLLAAAAGAGALALTTMSASAAIVCTGHVCWHTTTAYDYPPAARIVVHDDNWKWKHNENYRWREHEGRGYWAGSRWHTW